MAWGVPKIGANVIDATGNFDLIEPVGVAQGDLMVACIAMKGTAVVSLSGWTAAATQQNSGDTDATDGIASAAMFYVVRGSSAPNLTVTRTAGDVAYAKVLSYTPTAGNVPVYDTGTAATQGAAGATPTTGTITTAAAGELIVAFVAMGDQYTVSAFDAATDPTTASGATDTTTAPTNGTWIERFDANTNTGADTGIAIADAVRATAGATGTIQATVSSASGRNAMMAAAFKEQPATFTQAVSGFYEDGAETTSTQIAADSYSETNQDFSNAIYTGFITAWGQSFTGDGGYLTSAKFYLKKGGSPTGSAFAELYAHTGTFGSSSLPTGSVLATSAAFDVSTLTTSYQLITFTFAPYLLTDQHYCIVIHSNNGNASNNVQVGNDGSSQSHAGNGFRNTTEGSAWTDAGRDVCFYVYTSSTTRDVSSGDSNLQLRVRLQETNGSNGLSTDDYQLQYELNDKIGYYDVGWGFTDSFRESNEDGSTGYTLRNGSNVKGGQSITGDGGTIERAIFDMLKAGSPTGNMTVSIFAHSGTFGTSSVGTGAALATSDAIDAATLTTSLVLTSFTFSGANRITLTNGTNYVAVVEFSGGSVGNTVRVEGSTTNATHSGNACRYNGTTWTADGGGDITFYIVSSGGTPLVAGFNSASLTDGNATTNRLGSGTGSFVAGEISEDGLVDDLQITASNYTELLYSLTIESTAVADNDTLDFRVLRNGATTGMTYTVTPRITIEESAGTTHVVQDAALGLTMDNTTITQNHVLSPQDIALATRMDATTIAQNHVLTAQDITLALSEDNTTLIENKTIAVQDIALALTEDNTTINQNHVLTAQDVALALTEDNTTLAQNHVITAQDIALGLSTDNTTILHIHVLTVQDIQLSLSEDNTTITQNHVLTAQDMALNTSLEATSIAEQGNLNAQDMTLGLTIDNTTITQNHIIVVQDIQLSLTEDATTITQTHVLVAQDLALSTTTDNTTLAQNHVVAVQDLALALTEDATTLTQNHVLPVQDVQLSLSTDNTTIAEEGDDHTLVTQDSALALTIDNTTITQNHILVTQDIALNTSLEATSIAEQGQLNSQDMTLALTIDSTTITQNHVLVVQDITLGLTTDNTSLTQNHVLAPQDIALATTTDNTSVVQTNFSLAVQDISLSLSEDATTLTQNHVIAAIDLALALRLDNANLQNLIDARSYYIDSDANIYWVLNQDIGLVEKI